MTDFDAGDMPTGGDADLTQEHLADVIRDIGIPPRPAILQHLAQEMVKPEPDFSHMAQLIERDVSLSAGLLKTVNAPYYGLRQKVRSVREALLLLGLSKAARTIAGLALRQVFPAGPNLERFWDASDRIAQLSGWLVHEFGVRHGIQHEDAYTFALFRDCGIPILLRRFPNYKAILSEANGDAVTPFTEVEDRRMPTNHTVVGSLMAQGWWLPEVTCTAIRLHHDADALATPPSGMSRAPRHLVALAQLAEHLFQHASGMSRNQEWAKLGSPSLMILDADESHFPGMALRAKAFLDSLETI